MKRQVFVRMLVVALGLLSGCGYAAAEPQEGGKPSLKEVAAKYETMKSEKIDLVEASLDLEELAYGSVDRAAVRQWIDGAVAKAKKGVAGAKDPATTLAALNHVIYGDLQLKRAGDINDVEHTFLSRVMKNKSGQCVGFSTLFAVVGRRAGLDIQIVVAPKHVFVRYHAGDRILNVETLENGRTLSNAVVSRRASSRFLQHPSKMHFKSVSKKSVTAMMFNALGVLHYQNGKTDQAAEAFKASIRLAPDLDLSYVNLAVLYRLSGKYKHAERMNRLSLKMAENADDPHRELAALYFIQGRFDEAAKEGGLYGTHSVPLRSPLEVTTFLTEAASQAKVKMDAGRQKAEKAFRANLRGELARVKAIKAKAFAENEKRWLTPIKRTDQAGLLERLRGLTPNEAEGTYRSVEKYLGMRRNLTIPYRMTYLFIRNGDQILIRKRSKAEIAALLKPIPWKDSKAITQRLKDLLVNVPKNVLTVAVTTLQAQDHARVARSSYLMERDGPFIFVSLVKGKRRMMIDTESFGLEPFRIRVAAADLPPASLDALKAALSLQVARMTMSKPGELPEAMSYSEKTLTATVHLLEDPKEIKTLQAELAVVTKDLTQFLSTTGTSALDIRAAGPVETLDIANRTPLTPGKTNIRTRLLLVAETRVQGVAPGNFFINGQMSKVRVEKTRPLSRAVSFRKVKHGGKAAVEADLAPHLVSAADPESRRLFGMAYYVFRVKLARTTMANIEKDPTSTVAEHLAYHNAVSAYLARAWLQHYAKAKKLVFEPSEIDLRRAEYAPVNELFRQKADRLGVAGLITQYRKAPEALFAKSPTK